MINDRRNMNLDFATGQCDGSYKSLAPDRGGETTGISDLMERARSNQWLYPMGPGASVGGHHWPLHATSC